MKDENMSLEVVTGWFLAALKAVSFKGVAGVVGAAMLYMLMPPGPPVHAGTVIVDPVAYRRAKAKETGIRVAFAFVTSQWCGDWFVDLVDANAAWLQAAKHPHVFIGIMGAGGWYVGRWVALWLHKHQDTGLDEVVKDLKGLKNDAAT